MSYYNLGVIQPELRIAGYLTETETERVMWGRWRGLGPYLSSPGSRWPHLGDWGSHTDSGGKGFAGCSKQVHFDKPWECELSQEGFLNSPQFMRL